MNQPNALETVKQFLNENYRPEPNDDRAAARSFHRFIQSYDENDSNYKWRVAKAFEATLQTRFAPLELQRFVAVNAGREIEDDDHAREFLESIYEYLDLDEATDWRELI